TETPAGGRENPLIDADRFRERDEPRDDEYDDAETGQGGAAGHRGHARVTRDPMMPSRGLLADAYDLRGMRPARKARRPASTPSFIARAIATGSCASATAVFMRTASAPSSIANVASDAVPTPASTMTGTRDCALMMRMLLGF